MKEITCALALVSGVIGAGFASGQEIAYFFAAHGPLAPFSAAVACLTLFALFLRLPAQMQRAGETSIPGLCRAHLGACCGRLASGLFFLLCAITGGAMLAACADLCALMLPMHGARTLGLIASLCLAFALCCRGLHALALPGAALCILLPLLLFRLLALPAGEACFAREGALVRAAAHGVSYGALTAAMLFGTLPFLLPLKSRQRKRAVTLFISLFGGILLLGIAVLARHRQSAHGQMMPFVHIARQLGKPGFWLLALSMYLSALSTLCAMLCALMRMLPGCIALPLAGLSCLLFSAVGFSSLVAHGYPVLGAVCAGLLLLLCLSSPCAPHQASSSAR